MVVVEYFDVVPGDMGSEACAESFDDRLFSGKAPRKMGHRVLEFITVVLFDLSE